MKLFFGVIMINLGIIDIDTSHPGSFIPILRSFKDIEVTTVYDYGDIWDDKYVKHFASENKIPNVVKSIDEMLEKIDAVLIQGANWDRHLDRAIPFIEHDIPVLIDKPIVGSIEDVKKMKKIIDESSSVIFGGSSLLYSDDAVEFSNLITEEFSIIHAFGMGDVFNYGIHTVAIAQTILGSGAKTITYLKDEDHPSFRIEFFDERRLYLHLGMKTNYWSLLAQSQKEQYSLTVDTSNVYEAFLRKFVNILKDEEKYDKSYISLPLEASSILLGAKVAMEEQKTVEIDNLPDSVNFDGLEFMKEYRELRLKQWENR
tara:strand:+ start:4641 stop:5585 length:945 start_codon:yes stop_codon:yes gene_type:complete